MNVMEKQDPKQIIKIAALVIVVLIVLWQVYGLFSTSGTSAPANSKPSVTATASTAQKTNMLTPKSSNLIPKPSEQPLTDREKQLIKLQQETNAKYLVALSDLQMLKLNLQIAELNRSITRARLDTAKDEKKLVELIEGPNTPQFGQNIVSVQTKATTSSTPSSAPEVVQEQPQQPLLPQFAVISVSRLQGKWTAVVTMQGKVRVVSVGDELANQQGKIIKIDKAGVVVQNGKETSRVNIMTSI